ncbi:MAG: hypothetical protein QXL69_04380 [Candidatus Bathyarchaeia archaeon]
MDFMGYAGLHLSRHFHLASNDLYEGIWFYGCQVYGIDNCGYVGIGFGIHTAAFLLDCSGRKLVATPCHGWC